MIHIPDLVGYPINEAVELLKNTNIEATIIESYGKNMDQTEDARVIRQRNITANQVELIISFF